MSSSSKDDNWRKHWRGTPTILTTIKKASPYFEDPATGGRGTGYLSIGQQVTYVDALSQNMQNNSFRVAIQLGSYDASKPVYYTHIDNLTKPINRSIFEGIFKPQRFGLTGQEYTYDTYVSTLRQSITNRTDIVGELEDYLLSLVDYADSNASVGSFDSNAISNLPMNNIRNDFGECIGPIYCISRGFNTLNLGVNKTTSKIFIPTRSNEPLLDYYIVTPNRSIKVSAKSSGVSSNTLKVRDIIPLIEQNSSLLAQMRNSQEFDLMRIINNNNMVQGPIQAAARLGLLDQNVANSVLNSSATGFISNPELFDSIIRSDPRLVGILNSQRGDYSRVRITLMQISYACERLVIDYSRQSVASLNFTNIVRNALSNEMFFVHLSLNNITPSFTLRRAQGVEGQATISNLQFRTKNGYDFKKDKLGFKL
jgi:hypothetical protein